MGFSLKKITKSVSSVFHKVEKAIRPVVKAAIIPAATILTAPIGGVGGILAAGAQGAYETQSAVSEANRQYDIAVQASLAPAAGILPTDTVISVPAAGLTPAGQGSTAGGLYGPSAVNQAPGPGTPALLAGIDPKVLMIGAIAIIVLMIMRR